MIIFATIQYKKTGKNIEKWRILWKTRHCEEAHYRIDHGYRSEIRQQETWQQEIWRPTLECLGKLDQVWVKFDEKWKRK